MYLVGVYVDEIHVEMQTNVYISDNLFKYNNKCLIFIRAIQITLTDEYKI